jgi:hypothetical protein
VQSHSNETQWPLSQIHKVWVDNSTQFEFDDFAKSADFTFLECRGREIGMEIHSKVLQCLLDELLLFREYCGFALRFRVSMGALRRVVSGLPLIVNRFVIAAFFNANILHQWHLMQTRKYRGWKAGHFVRAV